MLRRRHFDVSAADGGKRILLGGWPLSLACIPYRLCGVLEYELVWINAFFYEYPSWQVNAAVAECSKCVDRDVGFRDGPSYQPRKPIILLLEVGSLRATPGACF